jgi:hypothetical protein
MSVATETEREWQDYGSFKVEFLPNSHRYFLHTINHEFPLTKTTPEAPVALMERNPVISVTSALSILDKPALRSWYGRMDAEAVLSLERDGELTGVPTDQAIFVTRQRGYGAEAKRDAGATRGTAVHEALRAYVQEGTIPTLEGLSDEVRGYVQALSSWLVDASPEPVMSERIVGSPKYGFAGRFDLLADLRTNDDPADSDSPTRIARTLIDIKTGAAHKYPEAHIQVGGGYPLAFDECGIEQPEATLIVSLDESGFYKTAPALGTPDQFLSVLNAHRAVRSVEKALRASGKG